MVVAGLRVGCVPRGVLVPSSCTTTTHHHWSDLTPHLEETQRYWDTLVNTYLEGEELRPKSTQDWTESLYNGIPLSNPLDLRRAADGWQDGSVVGWRWEGLEIKAYCYFIFIMWLPDPAPSTVHLPPATPLLSTLQRVEQDVQGGGGGGGSVNLQ